MKKKLLSLVMACAMALSLAMPAFASPYYTNQTELNTLSPDAIVFNTKIHVPTIKLYMPDLSTTDGAAPVVLNPYKLGYSGTDNKVNDISVGSSEDGIKQIISPVYGIKNLTNVALKFDIKATTEKGSSAAFEFATSHVGLKEKLKKVFPQLVIKKTEDTDGPVASSTAQTLNPFDTANYETIVLAQGDKNTSTSAIRKLAAVTGTSANWLLFQFQGSMTRTPDIGWTSDDTFATTLTFTFTPEGNQDYTATVTDIAVGSATQKATDDLGNDVKISLATATGTAFASNTATLATLKTGAGGTATKKDGTTAATMAKDLGDATAPAWELISAGAFGATINGTSGEITYPKSMGKLLTGSGTGSAPSDPNNRDVLVVGFNDFNGVPRTLGITVDIKYTTAAS